MTGHLRWLLTLAVVIVPTAAACATADPEATPITATDGQELFEMRALGGEPGCVTCHSLEPDVVLVGPSLADPSGAAARAGDGDAATYLRTSIVDPPAYSVPGFEDAKQMPVVFDQRLSAQQVDAIVDYLLEVDR